MGLSAAPTDEAVALSPEWLSAALGRAVVDVEVVERLVTVATKVRLRATCDNGAVATLCVKGFFGSTVAGRRGGQAIEAMFYERLAPTVDVRMPPCVHAGIDDDTQHGIVVMEDMKAGGCTFLDPRSSYTADQAAASLDQLAALHASSWGAASDALPGELRGRIPRLASLMDAGALQSQLGDGRAGTVPGEVRVGARLIAAMHAVGAVGGERCLVHGDLHTGNLYEHRDGSPGLIDWQVVQLGSWALDVSYHVATVLDRDTRASCERELLDHYLDRLSARGVVAPDREDAWWHYRAHLPYGYFLWAITRQVDRPVIEHLTTRLGLAVADHASFELLGV